MRQNRARAMYDQIEDALISITMQLRLAIVITITPREVLLVAHDNGVGLGEEASRATRGGIAVMRARAQSHKGLREFVGARNTGATVTASLPIARAS